MPSATIRQVMQFRYQNLQKNRKLEGMEVYRDEKEWTVLPKFQTASENFDSVATAMIVTEFLFISGIITTRIDWN